MKHRLRVVILAVCLIAGIALWLRSYVARDSLSIALGSLELSATSYLGGVHFMATHELPYGSSGRARSVVLEEEEAQTGWKPQWNDQYPAPMRQWNALGLGYASGHQNLNPEDNGLPRMPYDVVVLPYWLISLALAAGVLLSLMRRFPWLGAVHPRCQNWPHNAARSASARQVRPDG